MTDQLATKKAPSGRCHRAAQGPLWRPLLASCATLLLSAGCRTPARLPLQHYVPLTRSMQTLGELDLSSTEMSLAALEGKMKLQYAGLMPDDAGEELAGASVFRVKNAGSFFKKNAGRKGFCTAAPRWVAVSSRAGAPAWSSEIWVAFLTLENWREFSPDRHRYCAAGNYVRSAGEGPP